MNETSPTNKHSIISLVLGIITILLLCSSLVVPIPGTTVVCAPVFIIFAVMALIYGGIGLKRIKRDNEKGHHFAWTGIIIGGFVLLCLLCLAVTLFAAVYTFPNSIPIPPFINKYL